MANKRSIESIQKEEDAMMHLKGLLHVALNCIYLQLSEDIIIMIGQSTLDYHLYKHVLSPQDVYGKFMHGYMTQGRVEVPGLSESHQIAQHWHCGGSAS